MANRQRLSTSSTLVLIPALTTLHGILFLLPYLGIHEVDCFNINTKTANILHGPTDSNFGYSIRFTTTPGVTFPSGPRFYIGAPKFSNFPAPGQDQEGVIFVCDIKAINYTECAKIQDSDINNPSQRHQMVKERFGNAIALLQSSKLLVCMPSWRLRKGSYYFTPGRCALRNLQSGADDKGIKPYMITSKFVVTIGNRSVSNYGMAQFGMSADSNEGSLIAVGVPGLFNFEGGIYLRDIRENAQVRSEPELVDNLFTTAYSYMGYSVKFGRFCNTRDPCVIVGAPLENGVGAVRIFSWANREKLEEIQKLDGDSLWSYFGSSIAPADLDKDEYDEILVGAPYYTDLREEEARNPDRLDQGRVYVYTRKKGEYVFTQTLVGSNTRFSRFGISLQALGDINMDQNTDIAVGAPWEEDGCIYIFMGDGVGVKTPYAQRITAEQLPNSLSTPITGLGFELAALSSSDFFGLPVFVATSVSSNAVVSFYTRPIVLVTMRLVPSTRIIDPSGNCSLINSLEPCFHFNVTISYRTRPSEPGIRYLAFKLKVGVDVDAPTKASRRANIELSKGVRLHETPWTEINVYQSNRSSFVVVINKAQAEERLIRPIKLRAEYELVDNQDQDPILDRFTDTFVEEEVRFSHKCGHDDHCTVNLKTYGFLTFNTEHISAYDGIVVNATSALIVTIEVTNAGEPSYRTDLSIAVDSDTPYLRGPTNCQPQENKALVKCLPKLLRTGSKFTMELAFDTSEMSLDSNLVTVNVTAMPGDLDASNDTDLSDNTIILTADVALIADVTLEGSSSPSELAISQAKRFSVATKVKIDETYLEKTVDDTREKLNITHKALVKSMGPSFLPATDIYVAVPWFALDGTQLVKEANLQMSLADGTLLVDCGSVFGYDDYPDLHTAVPWKPSSVGSTSNPRTNNSTDEQHLTKTATTSTSTTTTTTTTTTTSPETTSPPTTAFIIPSIINRRRKKRSAGADVDTSAHVMNCELNPEFCKYFTCSLPSAMPAEDHATITANFKIDKYGIPVPQGFTSLYFTTTIQVKQPEHPLLKPWNKVPKITLLTKFHLREDGSKINIWIIVGSVAGGLVLITILVLVLWKCGFFKRDKHYQVEKWKRQSYRQSMKVASPNTEKCD